MVLFPGNKSDWLDITEWLVDRGAKKFVINVSRYLMTTSTCRRYVLFAKIISHTHTVHIFRLLSNLFICWVFYRLDKLLSQNVSVHIESDFHLRTKEETQDWLTRLASSHLLGSLFIINQVIVYNYCKN